MRHTYAEDDSWIDEAPAQRVQIVERVGADVGGLDGWRVTCTCGMRWCTSLSRDWAQREASDHEAWHSRNPDRSSGNTGLTMGHAT